VFESPRISYESVNVLPPLKLNRAVAAGGNLSTELIPAQCRRMALAVLFFPEGRTLALAEGDPYKIGASRAWHASSRHAAAAYDPAFMVPCGVGLLKSGQLSARSAVATGWLPLLLRSLGSRDDALRCDHGLADLSCVTGMADRMRRSRVPSARFSPPSSMSRYLTQGSTLGQGFDSLWHELGGVSSHSTFKLLGRITSRRESVGTRDS
jgi:hypothetical protein